MKILVAADAARNYCQLTLARKGNPMGMLTKIFYREPKPPAKPSQRLAALRATAPPTEAIERLRELLNKLADAGNLSNEEWSALDCAAFDTSTSLTTLDKITEDLRAIRQIETKAKELPELHRSLDEATSAAREYDSATAEKLAVAMEKVHKANEGYLVAGSDKPGLVTGTPSPDWIHVNEVAVKDAQDDVTRLKNSRHDKSTALWHVAQNLQQKIDKIEMDMGPLDALKRQYVDYLEPVALAA